MYASFFGLKHEPFSIAPDPRYLFMSERHREALAHLLYGVNGGGGFVLLSGEIGAGKTTVCRCFLEQIPRRTNVAYIFNPKLTVLELLQSVCDEFNVPAPAGAHGEPTVKEYLDPLNRFLLKTHGVGQNNLLIIDEAQMLSAEVLEQLRLLTNLETNERKLLQIILIGQPELRDLLARPELEQLAQRVIARYHLGALTADETERYLRHRLSVAGMTVAMPFDAKSIARIHQLSRGVPRRINLLADRALLGAYSVGKGQVDRTIVDKAAAEVFGKEHVGLAAPRGPADRRQRWGIAALAGAAIAAVVLLVYSLPRRGPAVVASAPAGSSASASGAAAASAGGSAPAAAGSSAAAARGASAAAAPAFLTAADLQSRFKALPHDERDAWRALAPAWKLALAADEAEPCAALQRGGLQCFRSSNTTLAVIRQLDRPGIVTLRDADEKPVYAVLTGLTDKTATLRLGASAQTVSLVSLATLWRGEFATLWRAPPGYTGRLVDPGSGAIAGWVGAQLAALQGQPVAGSDAVWRAQVASFQLSQGLKPDGLAGPTTFMQLNRATGVDEPRLRADAATYQRGAAMSYILDALRKADAERDRGNVPGIHAQPSFGGPPPSSAPPAASPWLWLAGGAAAVALVGGAAWYLTSGSRGAADVPVATAPTTSAPPVAPPPAAPPIAPAPAPAPAPVAPPPAVALAPRAEAPRKPKPAPAAASTAPAQAVAAAPAPSPPPVAEAKPAASGEKIYTIAELPDDIRRQLPNVAVGGSMYSAKPADRILIINGQVLHEGDRIAPDLTLQQIRLKAAILNFKGYRYTLAF